MARRLLEEWAPRERAVMSGLGLVALVGTVADQPFLVVACALWALALYCRRRTRTTPEADRRGLVHHLHASAPKFVVPAGVAVTLHAALALAITWRADLVPIDTLVAAETLLDDVSSFFSDTLKLDELTVLVLVGALWAATILVRRRADRAVTLGPGGPQATPDAAPTRRERVVAAARRGLDRYTAWSGTVATFLTTAAALSLFGMALGSPSQDLRERLQVAREGYADSVEQVEAEIDRRVAHGLVTRIEEAQSVVVPGLGDGPAALDRAGDDLRLSVDSARTWPGGPDPADVAAGRAEDARRARVDLLPPELRVDGARRTTAPPPDATPTTIARARDAATRTPRDPGAPLRTSARRQVLLQVEKMVSERLLEVTKPLTDAVPVLDPVISALAEAIDADLQQRLGRAHDRVVEVARTDPAGLSDAIDREARRVVEGTRVEEAVRRVEPRARLAGERLAADLFSLRSARTQVDQRVAARLAPLLAPTVVPRSPSERRPRLDLPRIPRLPSSYLPYRAPGYVTPRPPGFRPPTPGYRAPVRPPVRPLVRPFW